MPKLPTPAGPVGQNGKCKKVADNHLGSRGKFSFSVSGALAPGNCVFMFSARARNFSTCPRPRTGQHTTKSPFPTGGGPTEKKVVPQKVAENHPGYHGNIFFLDFRTPSARGSRKGPAELVVVACCLLARRARSTLVSNKLINRLKKRGRPTRDFVLA